jgi:hypothetical protein
MSNSTQTAIDFKSIEAGRELDKLIEQKVFKRGFWRTNIGDSELCLVPAYSTEIAAAYQVIEKLKESSKYEIVIWARCNIVQVMDLATEEYLADCSDESLPLAICRASLLALAATK